MSDKITEALEALAKLRKSSWAEDGSTNAKRFDTIRAVLNDEIKAQKRQKMALQQVLAFASQARPAGYERAILKIEKIAEEALNAG